MRITEQMPRRHWSWLFLCSVFALTLGPGHALADDDHDSSDRNAGSTLAVTYATWDGGEDKLTVRGFGTRYRRVTVVNAFDTDQVIGRARVRYSGSWIKRVGLDDNDTIPCRVRATQSDGKVEERDVANAPSDCAPKGEVEPSPVPNQAPKANAGPNQTLMLAQGQNTLSVSLNGSGSSDPDGTISRYNWTGTPDPADTVSPTVTLGQGSYTFTLVVTDNDGATSAADQVAITVNPAPAVNKPPTASAGPDQTVTIAAGQTDIAVTLNGSGSSDPDGTITTYDWTGSPNPANTVSPTVTLSAGSYTFTLVVADNEGASSGSDSVIITVNPAPPQNQAPTADAGPDQTLTLDQGQTTMIVTLDGSASSDPDGDPLAWEWTGNPNPANVAEPTVSLGAGSHIFTLVVRDTDGAQSASDSVLIKVDVTAPPPVACTSPIAAHCQITVYEGPGTCVGCHESQAAAMHGSIHYQQGGAFPNVTNIPGNFQGAGERPAHAPGDLVATGINTYCGTHENSPRFTCAGCHVGNGRFPSPQLPGSGQARANELANIDCLMCHQDVYKRFPDWTANGEGFSALKLLNVAELPNGTLAQSDGAELLRTGFAGIPNVDPVTADFQFLPAGIDTLPLDVPMPPMAITTLEAAQGAHATTRQSCLNCHAGAAGADGAKRGDLSRQVANNASTTLDFHMSPQGANKTCSDCHNAGGHRVRGRGLDLRPNDVPQQFTCDTGGCHSSQPHPSTTTGNRLNRHTAKVACQTCHIPRYAKADVGSEISRDWQDPHPSASACNGRGGWLPREDKGFDLTPTISWFDGKSEVYYLGESLQGVPTIPLDAAVASSFAGNFSAGENAYVIGAPAVVIDSQGNIDQRLGAGASGAKLYPMKEHWGKLASDGDTLIGHSTFEFFRTGSFCRAVAVGLGLDEINADTSSVCGGLPGDTEMPPGTQAVAVHTFQTINHGVEPSGNALECGACHADQSGGPLLIDLQGELGYELKAPATSNGLCNDCHGGENPSGLTRDHERSQHARRSCSDCHVRR